jgi:hypothetical protein
MERIIVHNAGLVIFLPFLSRLFEELSLVRDGAFFNQETRTGQCTSFNTWDTIELIFTKTCLRLISYWLGCRCKTISLRLLA